MVLGMVLPALKYDTAIFGNFLIMLFGCLTLVYDVYLQIKFVASSQCLRAAELCLKFVEKKVVWAELLLIWLRLTSYRRPYCFFLSAKPRLTMLNGTSIVMGPNPRFVMVISGSHF